MRRIIVITDKDNSIIYHSDIREQGQGLSGLVGLINSCSAVPQIKIGWAPTITTALQWQGYEDVAKQLLDANSVMNSEDFNKAWNCAKNVRLLALLD